MLERGLGLEFDGEALEVWTHVEREVDVVVGDNRRPVDELELRVGALDGEEERLGNLDLHVALEEREDVEESPAVVGWLEEVVEGRAELSLVVEDDAVEGVLMDVVALVFQLDEQPRVAPRLYFEANVLATLREVLQVLQLQILNIHLFKI